MKTFKIASLVGSDPSSRLNAASIRVDIERAGGPVVVDLDGVLSVSHSFADELFAVIVSGHGEEWFRENVRVVGYTREVRKEILAAIDMRTSATPSQ